jgi:hypothetical protein
MDQRTVIAYSALDNSSAIGTSVLSLFIFQPMVLRCLSNVGSEGKRGGLSRLVLQPVRIEE